MEIEELERLLADLRAFAMDHQTVEAKRARRALPETTWETLSAFANATGGVLLFGVDEGEGAFEITGVEEADQVATALQSLCTEMEPPLRPAIEMVQTDQGVVIVANVPPVPRTARPCHRRKLGPHEGSFIRVGDSDQKLSSKEVDELLANRSSLEDHSRRPAPKGAKLDDDLVREFTNQLRNTSARNEGKKDLELLATFGVEVDGQLTLAGLLALGDNPEAFSQAARIAYRLHTDETSRFAASHLEGTIGALLEKAVDQLGRDLNVLQVERDGALVDELEIPRIALREVIGNALLHRSLAATQDAVPVAIDVTPDAVEVTSPGGLHVTADIAQLGLTTLSGVRNLALVRICENMRTPGGARIVENQASGIAAADAASRKARTMPPLFVDQATSFKVILLRGALDLDAARTLLRGTKLADDPQAQRLVAVAQRMAREIESTPGSPVRHIALDARLGARCLSATPEDAAALLRDLESQGTLVRRRIWQNPAWTIKPDLPTKAKKSRTEKPAKAPGARKKRAEGRMIQLVQAIGQSKNGELRSSEIGEALGLTSTKSVNNWINKALDAKLVEPTTDSPYDPTRAYRLTNRGQRQYEASRSNQLSGV